MKTNLSSPTNRMKVLMKRMKTSYTFDFFVCRFLWIKYKIKDIQKTDFIIIFTKNFFFDFFEAIFERIFSSSYPFSNFFSNHFIFLSMLFWVKFLLAYFSLLKCTSLLVRIFISQLLSSYMYQKSSSAPAFGYLMVLFFYCP